MDTTERLHFHFSLSCTGEGNGNPLQRSCLENPRDGGAWWLLSQGSHRVGHNRSDLAAAAADVFLELSCFFNDPADVSYLISGSSAFSKSSLNIWKFLAHVLLKPSLENSEHFFALVCEMRAMAPYSSTLAWKIPWMVEPGRLEFMRSQTVGHD